MANVTLDVKGMTCNHCVMAVEGALKELKGVDNAVVDLQAGKVAVDFKEGEVSLDQMKEAIEEAGYEVA